MKYALSLVAGLLVGVLTALGAVYFNPLTQRQSELPDTSGWSFDYAFGSGDTWLSTHDDRISVPLVPSDVPLLWEKGVKGMMLAAMPLTESSMPNPVIGTKISVPSSDSELLRKGLVVNDHWLISVPGRGTLYVHATNNQWPLLRDTLVNVDWLGRDFRSQGQYAATVGPSSRGANVVGLTGEFASASGNADERLSLASYDGDFAGLSGELRIQLAERSP